VKACFRFAFWMPVFGEVAKALAPFTEAETIDPANPRKPLPDAKEK
jgi:hypothetical protein